MGLRGKSNYCGGFYVCTLMIIGKSNSNQNISCHSSSAWLKVHLIFGTKMESVRPKTPSKIVWINPGTLWCAIPDLVMQFKMLWHAIPDVICTVMDVKKIICMTVVMEIQVVVF